MMPPFDGALNQSNTCVSIWYQSHKTPSHVDHHQQQRKYLHHIHADDWIVDCFWLRPPDHRQADDQGELSPLACQFLPYLRINNLLGIVDGTMKAPPETITKTTANGAVQEVNP
jgi:hypothetical protein